MKILLAVIGILALYHGAWFIGIVCGILIGLDMILNMWGLGGNPY